jgi:uncharacterized protein YicC (UPF0701 family)
MTEASDVEPQENKEKEETETESAKKKYEFIEDLPGVGPATAQKLRELGYHTVESLAMATARELEPVGVSEKKSFAIIEAARSSIGISFIRADELLKMRQKEGRGLQVYLKNRATALKRNLDYIKARFNKVMKEKVYRLKTDEERTSIPP